MSSLQGKATTQPSLEVADVFRDYFQGRQRTAGFSAIQLKAMRNIVQCRTAVLGGHMQTCLACGDARPAYNSCRDRHCPKCQGLSQVKWVNRQMERVLPVRCFHIVFTLPAQLRPLAKCHAREVYDLLFKEASRTLLDFGRDPRWLGAQIGITAVLHTWARDLTLHPHLHCIVTAGGLSKDGRSFRHAPRRFLFPVKALDKVFRARFLEGLCRLRKQVPSFAHTKDDEAFGRWVDALHHMPWNVYAKAPLAGPQQVFRYLGQYTHRVGLSNHRLVNVTPSRVKFRTRGQNTVCVPTRVFVARFLAHILPPRFVKIRHYGLMANGLTDRRREQARELLQTEQRQPIRANPRSVSKGPLPSDWIVLLRELTGVDVRRCPACHVLAVVREPLPTRPGLSASRGRSPPKCEAST